MSEAVPVIRGKYQVSVRYLVDFVLRTGNLGGSGRIPTLLRAHEGSRAHRKLQKSRPADYEPEVHLTYKIISGNIELEIIGRIDGVWKRKEGILLEEIKTVTSTWDYQPDPLHWAQLKIYGWIFCQQNELEEIALQLTYLHLDTEQVTPFREKFSAAELCSVGESVVAEYLSWIQDYDHWIRRRNRSAEALRFPHPDFRKGQRDLCRAVYNTIVNKRRLFAEAPTGTGKTISVLFPAIKSLPTQPTDRIFFLTAKNTTQELAQKSLLDLAASGLHLRSITLTAKEKVCSMNGKLCDVSECPLAKGFFDRRKPAIREALKTEHLTREKIEQVAIRHQVCPHELSLDISEWVDLVICDYNYAFDPRAKLKRHFGETPRNHLLLIDEAHNLVDRAREMFSAELKSSILDAARAATTASTLKKRISDVEREMEKLCTVGPEKVLDTPPPSLLKALDRFIESAEITFAENMGEPVPDPLLQCYFEVNAFLQIVEMIDGRYRVIVETNGGDNFVRLLCLDPSIQLHKSLKDAQSSIVFSATLTPLRYFRSALGGVDTDHTFRLPSPFPPENLHVAVTTDIKTSFKHRTATIDRVCRTLQTFISARQGNYLVYFPSYAYLNDVLPGVQALLTEAEFIVQTSSMDESARDAFLDSFTARNDKTHVGFAVMGGIFGEGIDLVGERLIGVAVVGLGLPQLCLERNLIRNHFDATGVDGFDYAYLFPGLNRVFQAAGRLIRSEKDRGVVLLVDDRFTEARVRNLLPAWWDVHECGTEEMLASELKYFWETKS